MGSSHRFPSSQLLLLGQGEGVNELASVPVTESLYVSERHLWDSVGVNRASNDLHAISIAYYRCATRVI